MTINNPTHLSDLAAERITRNEGEAELAAFVTALTMQRPATTAKAAQLLEHVIKETMSSTTALLEDQMRQDGWQAELAVGETLAELAERAQCFLESPDGVRLYNFFAKTFARTSGEMFS